MAWANQSKNTASYSAQTKNTAVWDNIGFRLLKENRDLLLLETGFAITLESKTSTLLTWSNIAKS